MKRSPRVGMPRRPVLLRREDRQPVPRCDDVTTRCKRSKRARVEHELQQAGCRAVRRVAAPRRIRPEPATRRPHCGRAGSRKVVPLNELVVLGHVLTVDADRRTHRRGAVYIHDGRIERVTDESTAPPTGYEACAARTSRRRRRARPHRPPQPSRVQHACRCGSAGRRRTARATSGRGPRRTGPTSRTRRRRSASRRRRPRCASPR